MEETEAEKHFRLSQEAKRAKARVRQKRYRMRKAGKALSVEGSDSPERENPASAFPAGPSTSGPAVLLPTLPGGQPQATEWARLLQAASQLGHPTVAQPQLFMQSLPGGSSSVQQPAEGEAASVKDKVEILSTKIRTLLGIVQTEALPKDLRDSAEENIRNLMVEMLGLGG